MISAAGVVFDPGFVHAPSQTGKVSHTLYAHKAPVCALAVLRSSPTNTLLASAGWDKCIHFWLADTNTPSAKVKPVASIPEASNDFIKALRYLPSQRILLSGGSDKLLKAWNVAAIVDESAARNVTAIVDKNVAAIVDDPIRAANIPCSGTFSEHTRSITCIRSLEANPTRIYSADSMGRIFELKMNLSHDRVRLEVQRELRGPETSIASIVVGWAYGEDEDEDGNVERTAQVWAASHDKTLHLFEPLSSATSNAHQRSSHTGTALGSLPPLAPRLVIMHPDYVKSVLPLPFELGMPSIVLTGGADEDIRVYDLNQRPPVLLRQQQGHWHEVQHLSLWRGNVDGAASSQPSTTPPWFVISTGLDGSIRRWKLADLLKPQTKDELQALQSSVQAAAPQNSHPKKSGMTAEEERELEDLMMSDDDE